jgi:RND family efflux transporter MFP subunit
MVSTVAVVSQQVSTTVSLPGDLSAYQRVALYPKESGFLDWIGVDRGSTVKRGQVVARLVAPELADRMATAEAKLSADQATLARLTAAAATPGAVAQNDIDVATQAVAADKATVADLRTVQGYLAMIAPFDGVVTERDLHTGALAGPPGAGSVPLCWLEQDNPLRLTVAVPERYATSFVHGAQARFVVAAWPGVTFSGTIERAADSLDVKTRTMPVELDVDNTDGRLTPGMFAEVDWPVLRPGASLLVPTTAIVTATDAVFVERARGGAIERVPVQTGLTVGDLIEVFGPLAASDLIVTPGSAMLANGAAVRSQAPPVSPQSAPSTTPAPAPSKNGH